MFAQLKMIFDLENHLEIKMKENMLARFIIYNKKLINNLFLMFTYFLLHLINKYQFFSSCLGLAVSVHIPCGQDCSPLLKVLPKCNSSKKVHRTSHYSMDSLLTLHGFPPPPTAHLERLPTPELDTLLPPPAGLYSCKPSPD